MPRLRLALPYLLAACCLAGLAEAQTRPAAPIDAPAVRPLLQRYCLECHSTRKHEGDLDLERFTTEALVEREPAIWRRVVEQLEGREMPPEDETQPSAREREELVGWANAVLERVARAQAGDPGPVVLRRLSNAEYGYTIRDLTGVAALDPAREFPVDGAAGEGFSNVGNALVMSPTLLTKYLDAAKRVAEHVVLLPDGITFSPHTSKRDVTEAILADIRAFYRAFTDPTGADVVNLQGIVFATNEGGRLPLDRYLAASLEARDAGGERVVAVAKARGLSAKYLATLLEALRSREPSLLLDPVRAAWCAARPGDVPALVATIAAWQKALWKFSSVGHIGKAGGPKGWLEPVAPFADRAELRTAMPAAADGEAVSLTLSAGDAGDGAEHDHVVWQRPRFVSPGRPDLLLRDVASVTRNRTALRERLFTNVTAALAAAAEVADGVPRRDVAAVAQRHDIAIELLQPWLDLLGLGTRPDAVNRSPFTTILDRPSTYDFVRGWGSKDTPLLLANASDQEVRIPGTLRAHGVVVHPSRTLAAVVAWQSPCATTVRVTARVRHAHHECGNGVTWSLEWRRGSQRQQLASGIAVKDREGRPDPVERLAVRTGDLVSLVIGPRDGEHSCDLTGVDLELVEVDQGARTWDLARDCAPDILAGNPHADRHGNAAVWHFGSEPEARAWSVPAGSLLARWHVAGAAAERARLAEELQRLLANGSELPATSPDGELRRQLAALDGPLLAHVGPPGTGGGDPAGTPDGVDLRAAAPSTLTIRVPAELVRGREFVTTGALDAEAGAEGSVQFRVAAGATNGPIAGALPALPFVTGPASAARARLAAACDEFRALFPAALCYEKVVPVDEVVTLTQFYREDHELVRLMLDAEQARRLDALWERLHFVTQDALTQVDAFEQLWQFATQDADPKVFEPLREPIRRRAAAFRETLAAAETRHVDAVLAFAARAWRRPVTPTETDGLRGLLARLRAEGLAHEDAIRLLVARVLVAPAFLYRLEAPGPGSAAGPVTDFELASRLSYFLWSSLPDAELTAVAASGTLHEPGVLAAQTRRMLRDARVRRLAIEFGCAWLQIHGFEGLGEKSERHFPTFPALQGAMAEESVLFLTDLFQRGASALDLLGADHTFLNGALAEHYGIPGVRGAEWRRVDGVRRYGRGGILGFATTLSRHSGASRTSPILRGNWLCEVLLGEKLPRPPKNVPRLPDDEATETLTVRELTSKHSLDPRCAKCHVRIDPFGFALEAYDAIGRLRERDLGGRPIDTRVKTSDGHEFTGLEGLRDYLLTDRRGAFVKQFCRKLLGYALGRAVLFSDEPLLAQLVADLEANGYATDALVVAIVQSPQFRTIRGRESVEAK